MEAIKEAENELVISYLTMRKAVGWLGMLLPIILLFGNYLINHADFLNNEWFVKTNCFEIYSNGGTLKKSISHYYYSTVGELFTGTLSTVALFMFCYKGHKLREGEKGLSDKTMTTLAGIFAIGVIVFPTSADNCISDNIRSFLSSENTGIIHLFFAALFFITLSIISIVNFRRTEDKVSFGKKEYHGLYLACGIIMILCIVLIAIYVKFFENKYETLDYLRPTFMLETIALIAFGLSWLTKGKVDFSYLFKKVGILK
jgi:hypothetical protein